LWQKKVHLQDLAAIRLAAWWRCSKGRQAHRLRRRSANMITGTVRQFLCTCKERHTCAKMIQKAWNDSKTRFIARCLLARRRAKSVILVQRRWREILLSRHPRKLVCDADKKKATNQRPSICPDAFILSTSASSVSLSSQRRTKVRSCHATSMFCDFDFGLLSPALSILRWETLQVAVEKDNGAYREVGGVSDLGSGSESCEDMVSSKNEVQAESNKQRPKEEARKIRSAILVQRFWRHVLSKWTKERYYQDIAAAYAQCIWRGHVCRKQYDLLRGNKGC
jgi:hypothetical protein